MLVLTNILIISNATSVSYSLTRAQFVVITGLLNIELLGLQDRYLGGETMKVNLNGRRLGMSLWLVVRVMEMSLAMVRFAVGISCMYNNDSDFKMGGY
jgi:hypothetical protein